MKRVNIVVTESTANFLKWRDASDLSRSKYRAKAARRLIEFWERVKNCRNWTSIKVLSPIVNSERRWVRRNLYTLEVAGLLETRKVAAGAGAKVTYFRRAH